MKDIKFSDFAGIKIKGCYIDLSEAKSLSLDMSGITIETGDGDRLEFAGIPGNIATFCVREPGEKIQGNSNDDVITVWRPWKQVEHVEHVSGGKPL